MSQLIVADQLKLQLPSWVNMMQLIGFSKDFFELVRDIGEAKSKEEEERIIKNEAQKLKTSMAQPDQSKKMREYLVRAIYCVMLGHDIPFAYVHALTMTQDPKIYNKRTGYLAVSLCMHENHELLLMVVNSIQKGLVSTNYLEVCSALIALCKLINADTIPAFLPTVINLLTHQKAAVRKKACMAVHRFWLKSPESISHLADKLRVVLCDRDPSVMAASLCLFLDMARVDPTPFKDLIPSFVSILKQVAESRLPRSYEYHHVPAPWIQINLLKLLALLGADDQASSEHMYEVLLQTLQRAEKHKNNAGYAVLYEAIMATTRIRANNALLEAAANSIGQLIRVRNHNLKYLGIQALAAIVRVAPRFVAPHQMEVIECLESTDESIKRKTLDLLYRMTNTKNVVVIVAKLIEYLQTTVATEELVRAELVSRINELAERYAPNNHWYIDTMNVMLQVGGTHVRPEVAYNLIRLISQGSGNSEEEDVNLRHYAVTVFLKSLESGEPLPDIQVQVLSWVISEYCYLVAGDSVSLEQVVARFADLMERPHSDLHTRGWILTGLQKLAAQLEHIPPSILSLTQKYTRSRYPDLMMRAHEFLALVHNPSLMVDVLPVDASCEDLEVDTKLSFLDAYASRGIATGVFKPYIPREQRKARAAAIKALIGDTTPHSAPSTSKKELNFSYPAPTPTPTPTLPVPNTPPPVSIANPPTVVPQTGSAPPSPHLSPEVHTITTTGIKAANAGWSREGFSGKTATTTPVTKTATNTTNPISNTPATTTPVPTAPLTGIPLSHKPLPAPPPPKLNEKQATLANQLFSGLAVGPSGPESPPSKPASKPRAQPTRTPSTTLISSIPVTTSHIPTSVTPSTSTLSPAVTPTSTPVDSSLLIDLGDLSAAFSTTTVKPTVPTKISTPTSTPTSPLQRNITPAVSPVQRLPSSPSLLDDTPSNSLSPTLNRSGTTAITPTVSTESLLAPSAPLAGQITAGSNFGVDNLTYTPFFGSIFDGSSQAPYERIGKDDERLQVGYVKVQRPDETLVVLLVSNKSTTTLTDVTTTVQVPDHFTTELTADPLVKINFSSKTFSLSALPPSKTALEVLRLRHKKFGFNLAISAQVQYTCDGRRTNVPDCNVLIEISDLLRPHTITIDTVGKIWHTHSHENKSKLTPAVPVASSAALLARLKTDLGVHTVQVIGNEGIGAASLLNGELLLLMHVNLTAQGVDVTVRSKDKSFTEVVTRYLHKLLR